MQDTIDLNETKRRLSLFLKHYEQARSRADFLEVALGIQTALENALDAQLSQEDAVSLSFAQKFEVVLPNLASAWNVAELGGLRNRYAHPYTTYTLEQYRHLADELVGLTLAAWPRLFGGASPGVTAPESLPDDDRLLQEAGLALRAQKQELDAADAKVQTLTKQLAAAQIAPAATQPVIPWRALLIGLALLLPVALLVGFAVKVAARRPVPWLLAVVPTVLALVVAFFAVRYLWRFIRAVGPLRVLASAAIVLLLATLLLIPFTGRNLRLTARAGDSLAIVLRGLENTVGVVPGTLAKIGGSLAESIVVPRAPSANDQGQTATLAETPLASAPSNATATPVTAQPSPTATPVPAATATPRPSIRVGSQVVVRTDGTPLMGRAAATTDAEIVTRFEDGVTLLVVAGPEEAAGLTWWQVEGEDGAGWSAADYLERVEE